MLAPQRLTQLPHYVFQNVKDASGQLVARAAVSAQTLRGGAGELFETLQHPGAILSAIPLWYPVDGLSKQDQPSDRDSYADPAAIGDHRKPSRTEVTITASFGQLWALWLWVHTLQATLAGALYTVFNSVLIAQVSRPTWTQVTPRTCTKQPHSGRLCVCSFHAQLNLLMRCSVA